MTRRENHYGVAQVYQSGLRQRRRARADPSKWRIETERGIIDLDAGAVPAGSTNFARVVIPLAYGAEIGSTGVIKTGRVSGELPPISVQNPMIANDNDGDFEDLRIAA